MARFSTPILRRYLFGGQIYTRGCTSVAKRHHVTQIQPGTPTDQTVTAATLPFRKQLKDEARRRKAETTSGQRHTDNAQLDTWELTVGVEIHAQLNTARKLFSTAASTINDTPNTHVAPFDLAIPGSLPVFQRETIVPAIRAALALNCQIQKVSKFDRKHYFHWDQPAGYQITQYYKPFAKDGHITLYAHDGIAQEDGEEVTIGIKQIQMEQDTAKTISQPGDIRLLDYNRVGLPLIEVITLPQIHHPATAAALVRKVQATLNAVNACVLGMESGGLRADVNVSVRRRDSNQGSNEYAGVRGLGQRTEIKNLSSFKSVKDAIVAERDRQIALIESGGVVAGETRGWTIGSTETRRLRGKEGEVDYRYMPDPDLSAVIIEDDLIDYLHQTLGVLPEQEVNILVDQFGLTFKDAASVVCLNDGGRYEYLRSVIDEFLLLAPDDDIKRVGRLCGNWVLHEMGGLTHPRADEENPLGMTSNGDCIIDHHQLAKLIYLLDTHKITGRSAKKILLELFMSGLAGSRRSTEDVVNEEGLWFSPLSKMEYEELAKSILDMKVVEEILAGKEGKINFLVGKMMRRDSDGRVDPQEAMATLQRIIGTFRK